MGYLTVFNQSLIKNPQKNKNPQKIKTKTKKGNPSSDPFMRHFPKSRWQKLQYPAGNRQVVGGCKTLCRKEHCRNCRRWDLRSSQIRIGGSQTRCQWWPRVISIPDPLSVVFIALLDRSLRLWHRRDKKQFSISPRLFDLPKIFPGLAILERDLLRLAYLVPIVKQTQLTCISLALWWSTRSEEPGGSLVCVSYEQKTIIQHLLCVEGDAG